MLERLPECRHVFTVDAQQRCPHGGKHNQEVLRINADEPNAIDRMRVVPRTKPNDQFAQRPAPDPTVLDELQSRSWREVVDVCVELIQAHGARLDGNDAVSRALDRVTRERKTHVPELSAPMRRLTQSD